jgi:hypothetical protein
MGPALHTSVRRRGSPLRRAAGDRWFVDETYLKGAGRWRYLYRAVDQYGQVIDVLLSGCLLLGRLRTARSLGPGSNQPKAARAACSRSHSARALCGALSISPPFLLGIAAASALPAEARAAASRCSASAA